MPGRTSHACWRDPTQEALWHLPWDIEIPLKRYTDTCCGILMCYTRPFIVPTQEAYWHLTWDCYLYRMPTQCAHSRGILMLAVGLLLVLSLDPLSAPLKWHPCQLQTFILVATVTCSGLKPTHAHSRDNTVKLSWASHHYYLFWIYY